MRSGAVQIVAVLALTVSGCAVNFNYKVTASPVQVPTATALDFDGRWWARPGVCSALPLTLRVLDQFGAPIAAHEVLAPALTPTGTYSLFTDAGCSTPAGSAAQIAAGASSTNLYFSAAGAATVSLDASLTGLTSATVSLTVGDEMSFASPVAHSALSGNIQTFVTGDFDGNGTKDILMGYQSQSLSLHRGVGDGTFLPIETVITLPGISRTADLAPVDVNSDGKLDLLIADYVSDRLYSYLNNGSGAFTLSYTSAAMVQLNQLSAGDLNGDGFPDAVVARTTDLSYQVYLGDGVGGFSTAGKVVLGCNVEDVQIGRYDGDTIPDIAVACGNTAEVRVLLGVDGGSGNGNGTFAAGPVTTIGNITDQMPWRLTGGRLEGAADTTDDLVIGFTGVNAQQSGVLTSNGNGTFDAPAYYTSGPTPAGTTIADFDGDGDQDVAVAFKGNGGQVRVFRNGGTGVLTAHTNYNIGVTNPSALHWGDIDGDGEGDLIVDDGTNDMITILRGVPQ